jgi:S1-C subfamily serine protease
MSKVKKKILQSIDGGGFEPFKTVGGPIQECVMPLLSKVNDVIRPVGTAFAIHPHGLLLTARHVLEEAVSHAEARQRLDGTSCQHYELQALYMSSGSSGTELLGGPLPVLELWGDEHQDVAIVRVDLPRNVVTGEPLRLRTAVLGTRPPKEGNPVVAVGYYKMAASSVTAGQLTYQQETAISAGRVTEVFHERRDRTLAKYPCFHVDARFDSGMSGGPIFDDRNRVCGIVSRGVTSVDGQHTGLGASIWPALALPMQLNVTGEMETTTLFDLARRKLLRLDEREAELEVVEGVVRIHFNAAAKWTTGVAL